MIDWFLLVISVCILLITFVYYNSNGKLLWSIVRLFITIWWVLFVLYTMFFHFNLTEFIYKFLE